MKTWKKLHAVLLLPLLLGIETSSNAVRQACRQCLSVR